MSDVKEHCGLFGKVPQQADFVSHHLAEEYTEYWHTWLQSSMSVSREQLGDDWLNYFLTSPVWNFAIGPGICSPSVITGVMIPSMDEVGRYFPLTLAHAGSHLVWDAYLNGREWYQSLEAAALKALDETTGYTHLIEVLESLEIPEFTSSPVYQTRHSVSGIDKSFVLPVKTDETKQNIISGLLDKSYRHMLGNYSLWWTQGSQHIDPCLLVSANLPDAGQFAAMLDGDWHQWNWAEEQLIHPDAELVQQPEPVIEDNLSLV